MRGKAVGAGGSAARRLVRVSTLSRCALPLWLALCGGVVAAAQAPRIRVSPEAVEPLRAGVAASERGDCAETDRLLRPLIEGGDARRMSDEQAMAFGFIVSCEAKTDQYERAYADALAGTKLDGGTDYLWRMRLLMAIETGRIGDAVATAELMQHFHSAAFAEIDVNTFYRLDRELKEKGDGANRERLLTLLLRESWQPANGVHVKDDFRVQYAGLMIERPGGEAEARARISELTSPDALRDASLDPRLRPLLPAGFDLRAATEAMLKLDLKFAAAHPDRLRPITFAANDLRALGRLDEAVALLQTAVPRLRDPKGFSDRARALPWWWDVLARAEEALGHYGEAVAALQEGAKLLEHGRPNDSQVINLAIVQTRFGHAADALETLAAFEDPKRRLSP